MAQNFQLNSDGLVLDFVKEVDRWLHQVTRVCGKEREGTVVLSSSEGDANDDWPPSPPLQTLDRHELDANRLAVLGVGKSGHSHWSASFECRACDSRSINPNPPSLESAPGYGGIRIELACLSGEKSQEFPPQLGSRYQLTRQIQGSQAETGSIQLHLSDPSLGQTYNHFDLIVSPLSGTDWGTELQLTGSELFIRPTRISLEPRKPTRWGYWLRSCDE